MLTDFMREDWAGVTGTLHNNTNPLKARVDQLERALVTMRQRQDSMAGTMGAQQKYINRLKKALDRLKP